MPGEAWGNRNFIDIDTIFINGPDYLSANSVIFGANIFHENSLEQKIQQEIQDTNAQIERLSLEIKGITAERNAHYFGIV